MEFVHDSANVGRILLILAAGLNECLEFLKHGMAHIINQIPGILGKIGYGGSDHIVHILDAVCSLLGGIGEFPDLSGNHGKALSCRTCVGGLHGSVQGDQPGLLGDGKNFTGQVFDLVYTLAFFDGIIEGTHDFFCLYPGNLGAAQGGLLHGVCAGIHLDRVGRDGAALLGHGADILAYSSCAVIDGGYIAGNFPERGGKLACQGREPGGAFSGNSCLF